MCECDVLKEKLARALEEVEQLKEKYGKALMDLDWFKRIEVERIKLGHEQDLAELRSKKRFLAVYLSGPQFGTLTDDGVYQDHTDFYMGPDWVTVLRCYHDYVFVMMEDLDALHARIAAKFPENKMVLVTFEQMRREFDIDNEMSGDMMQDKLTRMLRAIEK